MALRTDPQVSALVEKLASPLKQQVEALRRVILGVSPHIEEAVKWNAPSYKLGQHFATMNLRTPGKLRLVLHAGTKERTLPAAKVDDPEGLLTWLGEDRCLVTLDGVDDIRARRAALEDVVRAWITRLGAGGRPALTGR
jgi:Domain of unknown function (DU1801)